LAHTVIKAEKISKVYTLSHETPEQYSSLRDVLSKRVSGLFRGKKALNTQAGALEQFLALNDISFEINKGDRVGVIGRNGAGKSTLLKVLSRITEPSSGRITLHGRVASLLEVGTGFHPELTGRENIFLNGAILGMSRSEIRRKFDEIVAFAEVEQFLDTPVKRYSSGMYVRLAFAVAAHLEPEILVVDEVLAVGDAQFQKKCLGKMEDVSKNEGRTVLFVSHNMAAIKALCSEGIFLQKGSLVSKGNINDIIQLYLRNKNTVGNDGVIPERSSLYNSGVLRYTKLQLADHTGDGSSVFYQSPIKLYAEIDSMENVDDVIVDVRISNSEGFEIVHACNRYDHHYHGEASLTKGRNVVETQIDNHLQPGKYSITMGVHLTNGATLEYVENILDFEVLRVGAGEHPGYVFNWDMGVIRFNSTWRINQN
jgi:lipopolysaccharide transport system ATP-binding protein